MDSENASDENQSQSRFLGWGVGEFTGNASSRIPKYELNQSHKKDSFEFSSSFYFFVCVSLWRCFISDDGSQVDAYVDGCLHFTFVPWG